MILYSPDVVVNATACNAEDREFRFMQSFLPAYKYFHYPALRIINIALKILRKYFRKWVGE